LLRFTVSGRKHRLIFKMKKKSKYFESVRKKLGVNKQRMADICGVHWQTWNHWETGEREPNNATIRLVTILALIKDCNIIEDFL